MGIGMDNHCVNRVVNGAAMGGALGASIGAEPVCLPVCTFVCNLCFCKHLQPPDAADLLQGQPACCRPDCAMHNCCRPDCAMHNCCRVIVWHIRCIQAAGGPCFFCLTCTCSLSASGHSRSHDGQGSDPAGTILRTHCTCCLQVPGVFKIRHIGQTTVASAGVGFTVLPSCNS